MIALYARVSTQEQAVSGHSIAEQESRLEAYCAARGWKDFQHFTDAGFSGGSLERPAMQDLIKAVQRGQISRVLVYKLDRLSRSQKDTLYLIEDVFLQGGADFLSISENFDTASPFGRAMIGMLAVFAQLERDQIRERMTMGRTARSRQGNFHGSGNVPIGYDYDGALHVNEYEAGLIRALYQKAAAGVPIRRIVREMNENGLVHKYGEWNPQTVRKALSRRTYIGEVSFAGKWYQGQHEPIISRELFEEVQRIIIDRRIKSASGSRLGRATTYLSGLCYCARCGAKYTPQRYTHGAYIYDKYSCASRNKRNPELIKDPACKNKAWSRSELENLIFDQIRQLRLDPSRITPAPEQPDVRDRIAQIDAQIRRLVELYAVGSVPMEMVREKTVALQAQKDRLLEVQPRPITPAEAQEKADTLDDLLDNGSFDEIRALLFALIDRIEIDGEDVSIYWKFTP